MEHHSVCPLVGIGTLPTQPLSRQRVCLPPEPGGGGGAHSPAGDGLGEFQVRRLEKKLSTLDYSVVRAKVPEADVDLGMYKCVL